MKIKSSGDAGSIITSAIQSHAEYWKKIHDQEDFVMNGREPFNFEELKEKGISWANNRNYGEGKSEVEQAVSNSTAEILKSISLMDVEFENFDEKKHKNNVDFFLTDKYLKDIIGGKIAYCYEEVLTESNKLRPFITSIEYGSFFSGYSPVLRSQFKIMGDPVHITAVAFEDKTETDDLKTWVIFDIIKADVLLAKLEETRRLENDGVAIDHCGESYVISSNFWIIKGLEQALYYQLNQLHLKKNDDDKEDWIFNSWDDIDILVGKKGKTWITQNINNINIAKIYTKEDNGFCETYVETRAATDSGNDFYSTTSGYLMYQRCHVNVAYNNFINLVQEFSVAPTRYIQDLRGAGKFIAAFSLWYDIKQNTIEDKLLLNKSVVIKTTDSLSRENAKITPIAGMILMPEGVEIGTSQIDFDLGAHVQSIQMDKREHRERTFHYQPKADLTSRPTKDEVQMVSREVSKQSQNRLQFKLSEYSNIFTVIFEDLVTKKYRNKTESDVQDNFFRKLKDELQSFNLKDEDIKSIVKKVRRITISPVLQDIGAIKEVLSITPNGAARNKLLKMYFLALGFNRRDVNIFISDEEFGNDLSIAALENAAFYDTQELVVTTGQDHITHLNTHYGKVDRVFKGIKAGEDPVRNFNFINNALSNCQKHLELLQVNPFFKNKFKEFANIQKFFTKEQKSLADQISAMQERMQQEGDQKGDQQIPPQVRNKMYIDRIKALDKIERTNQLQQAASERKRQDFEMKQQLAQAKVSNDIELKKQLADMQKEIELLKASSKLS